MLEGLGGLTGEAVKSVGVGASELMLHFPNTAKKVPQNRPGYPDWAGKCSKLIPELIPELGPSTLAHLSEHPVPGTTRQSGEIRHFCIPYGIPESVEPWHRVLYGGRWWLPPSPSRGESNESVLPVACPNTNSGFEGVLTNLLVGC